jgi:DNA mismatch repair protein MutL
MPSNIQILPDEIVNQIAAGEVVENPASVVKELVENSLDAKAQRVDVRLIAGGLHKISIQDDGCGMSREDLLCSLKRHATSKIRAFEDLMHLHTMGFRGEALASIAAVSKIQMESASADDKASLLYAEGGHVLRMESTSRTLGTTIEVGSLFYNVPARKRFQKSIKASSAEVHRVMTRLSLAYPQIGFSLFSQETKMIDVEYGEYSFEEALERRIKALFGEEFFSQMVPLAFEDPSFRLLGWIGKPLFAKQSRSSQYLLINQRAVFSPLADRAIREGYGTRLSDGMHPTFVLHLQIDPEMVDVNVHPQKREVRLRDEQALKKKISSAICAALDSSFFSQAAAPHISIDPSLAIQEAASHLMALEERSETSSFQASLTFPKREKNVFRGLKIIGSYYLVELERKTSVHEEKSIAFIDLARAYSRLLFDSLEKALLETDELSRNMQPLLAPLMIGLSESEILSIEENLSIFSRMGWEVRVLGKRALAIDSYPAMVREDELLRLFSLMIEDLSSYGESEAQKRVFLQRMAEKICSFAQANRKNYSAEMADLLVEKLFSCKDPDKDPLGRPNFAYLQTTQIQELFLGGEKKSCK